MNDFTAFNFKEDYKTSIPIGFYKNYWESGTDCILQKSEVEFRTTFTKELLGYIKLPSTTIYKLETRKVKGLFRVREETYKVAVGTEDIYVYITTKMACFASKILLGECVEQKEREVKPIISGIPLERTTSKVNYCQYNDGGFCYAPEGCKTNDVNGECRDPQNCEENE